MSQSACQYCALVLEFNMPGLIVCLQELENQVNKRMFFLQQKEKKLTHELQLPAVFTEAFFSNICMPYVNTRFTAITELLNCLNG